MKNLRLPVILLLFSLLSARPVLADAPLTVLASVHPLALVAASVVPAEQLRVLLPAGMTPHDFSLRPSDIDVIQSAAVVFWAGAEAEPYLAGFVRRWPDKIWIDVSALSAAGEESAAGEHTQHDHNHDHAHDHDHADPHWWLSPDVMVQAQAALAQALGVSPGHFAGQVAEAVQQAERQLQPLRGRGFFVFHRAYDHWVERMQLNQVGAFTLSPEHKPGARTLQRMRGQLQNGEVVCVFSEPEYSPALVDSVVKGLNIRRGELDPLAAHIPLQADGYALLIRDLAQRFHDCLQP